MTQKPCKACGLELPLESFVRNRSRPDGFMEVCKKCSKDYKPSRKNRDLSTYEKPCESCSRTLSARMFVSSAQTEDKLSARCRTCSAALSGTVDAERARLFEQELADILRTAASQVEDPATDRALFENYVAKEFRRRGLDREWKLPVWVNAKTLLE